MMLKPFFTLSFLALFLAPLAAQDSAPMVPTSDLIVPADLEVTVWARSPMFFNPTNMDTDANGRLWVAEGVNYRRTLTRPEGDRIVVLEDTDGDGHADSSHTFVQDPELISPLGVSVFDNQIVVAQPPHILVYTDVDRDLKFDPSVDKREEFLSGFNARNHDHSLHTTVAGPDGKWYINNGNCGAQITDADGREFNFGGPYYESGAGKPEWFNNPTAYAGKPSADGQVYSGGFAGRINPDGTGLEIVGHGLRNSYELCVNSFGDIFQNDNDDPPACRNTWLMEGGFLGFFSRDGTRLWQTDRRPGQAVAVAHWRQDDPGVLPAGDVHGGGSPTGVAFYENGALGAGYEGMFLSAEARARLIQRYFPTLSKTGAGIDLGKRDNFLSSPENVMFRPSDITVGADGALYVADWYDSGVGGHKAADETHSGTIYRIAPKGFNPKVPAKTGDEIADGITLLKSPAQNVRFTGFNTLKAAGEEALPSIMELLDGDNLWFRARATWLLPHLGEEGILAAQARLSADSPQDRILAFRALRASGRDVLKTADWVLKDESPAVRREFAVSLRNYDARKKLPIVIDLFKTADGNDRYYLEAVGLAASGIETEVWESTDIGRKEPIKWSEADIWKTWRLQTEAAVPALIERATSEQLSYAERKFAMESMAHVGSKEAVDAITEIAAGESDLSQEASWWMINRGLTQWAKFGTRDVLKARGIYDPDTIVLQPTTVPDPPETQLPSPEKLASITGDIASGKIQSARCVMCHSIDGIGVEYGPDLRDWVSNQGKEAFYEAVIHPSAGIAHGFQGFAVNLKNGDTIEGLVFSKLDPVVVVSTGGLEQMVPRDRIKNMKKLWNKSLMLSADQLGLSAQNLVDLATYLETYTSTE